MAALAWVLVEDLYHLQPRSQVVHGAKLVVSVDCNPAQSALLEMKKLAIEHLDYEDVWQLFGEGKHPNFKHLFLTKLGPFMTEKSYRFWDKRCYYIPGI